MASDDETLRDSMLVPKEDPYRATRVRGSGRLMVPSELGHTPYAPPPGTVWSGGQSRRPGSGSSVHVGGQSQKSPPLPGGDTGEFGDTGDTGVGDTGDTGYTDTPPLDPGTADDFTYYQGKYIYKDPSGAAEKATADLNRRLNLPEEMGTTSSSEHPDWRGTGWTMHELIGSDGVNRYFLENPDTGKAYNITGHPKAGRE